MCLLIICSLTQTESEVFTKTRYYPDHIESDQYISGNIVFINQHSLKTTSTDNSNSIIIAGDPRRSGDTTGQSTKFQWPRGFLQITSSQIIISDTGNHCLKLLDRSSGMTKVLAGQCSSAGYLDGAASHAKFSSPWTLLTDNQNTTQLLVSENQNGSFRTICRHTWSVGTWLRSEHLNLARDFIQGPYSGDLYVSANNVVYHVTYQSREVTFLVGSFRGLQNDISDLTQLIYPHGLQWITQDSFLVADLGNSKVGICNLNEMNLSLMNTSLSNSSLATSSLMNASLTNSSLMNASLTNSSLDDNTTQALTLTILDICTNNITCQDIYEPVSFLLTSHSLYIGLYEKILLFECKLQVAWTGCQVWVGGRKIAHPPPTACSG